MLESCRLRRVGRARTRGGGKAYRSLGAALATALMALSCAAFERQSRVENELILGRSVGREDRVTIYVDPHAPAVVLDGQRQPLPLVDAVLAHGADDPEFAADRDLVITGAAELGWYVQTPLGLRLARWEVSVFDESGAEVWRVEGLGRPPARLPWQLGRGGEPLRPGVYRYRIAALTPGGDLGEGRWRRVRSVSPRGAIAIPARRGGVGGRPEVESDSGPVMGSTAFPFPGFVTIDGSPAPADLPSETTVAVSRGTSVVVDLREQAGRRVRLVRSYPFTPEPSELEMGVEGSIADRRLRLGADSVDLPLVAASCAIRGDTAVAAGNGGISGIHFTLESPGPVASWLVRVVDDRGHKVAELDGLGPPPPLAAWSGTTAEGSPLTAGLYSYRCLFLDDRGNRTMTAWRSFAVDPTSGVNLDTGSALPAPWWGGVGLHVRLADHLLPVAPDGTFAGTVTVPLDGSIDLELSSADDRRTIYRIPLRGGGLARSATAGIPRAGAPPGSPYLGSGPPLASATAPQEAELATRKGVHRQSRLVRAALFAAADQPSFVDSLTTSEGVDAISGYAAKMPDKRLDASGRPPLGDPSGPAPLALPSGPAPILPPSGPRPRHFPPSGPPPQGVEVIWWGPPLVPQV